jgi:uncharacterized membrane protein
LRKQIFHKREHLEGDKGFMAFCAKCGAQLNAGSGFCGACGAAASGQSVTTTSGAAVAPASSPAGTASTGMTNNVAACLSYLFGWVTGLIFLLIEPYKNDRFVRFNAFQSIFLNVAVLAIWIGVFILSMIMGFITRGLSIFLMGPLMMIIWLGVVVAVVVCMIKAYGNQEFKLPIIGDLAKKQAGG